MVAFFVLVVALVAAPASAGGQAGCGTWQDCREKALAAAAGEDFERSHDLAWKALQKGPKNDPALMTLVARAQSLSGRPHDALVMLERLAAMGVVTDAAESEDFRRVRALAGWADLQARLGETPGAKPAEPTPRRGAPPRADPAPKAATPPAVAPPAVKDATAETAAGEVSDALRFTSEPFVAAGLAYDPVSNRFIVADRRERKLSVIGERSQRMSNLIGAESGGFGEIGGIAIDRREGDLWVASTAADGGAAKLHKLQLISGRVLWSAVVSAEGPPATFGDLALTPSSDVLALDVIGRRIFRLRHQEGAAHQVVVVASLDPKTPTSIAPASDTLVYVAHREGICRADLAGESVREVKSSKGIDLTGFAWIRWHRGQLLGVQRAADDSYQIVRVRLDGSGGTATRVDVLERRLSLPSPMSAVLTANALYYLTVVPESSHAAHVVVRRIQIN